MVVALPALPALPPLAPAPPLPPEPVMSPESLEPQPKLRQAPKTNPKAPTIRIRGTHLAQAKVLRFPATCIAWSTAGVQLASSRRMVRG